MYRLPSAAMAMSPGPLTPASVAGPPSPSESDVPLPATVVMTPSGPTRRIRPDVVCAMKRLPSGPSSTASGTMTLASVAGPPSPRMPVISPPATVVIVPSRPDPPNAVIKGVSDVERAVYSRSDPMGTIQRRLGSGPTVATETLLARARHGRDDAVQPDATNAVITGVRNVQVVPSGDNAILPGLRSWASVAGPPSPLKPLSPVPAIVVMTHLGPTRRIRSVRRVRDVDAAVSTHRDALRDEIAPPRLPDRCRRYHQVAPRPRRW